MTEREGFAPSYLYLGKVPLYQRSMLVRLYTPVGVQSVSAYMYLLLKLVVSYRGGYRGVYLGTFDSLFKGTLTG